MENLLTKIVRSENHTHSYRIAGHFCGCKFSTKSIRKYMYSAVLISVDFKYPAIIHKKINETINR